MSRTSSTVLIAPVGDCIVCGRVRRYAVGPSMHSFCLVGRVRVNRRRWFTETVMCEDGAVADWQLIVVLCVVC